MQTPKTDAFRELSFSLSLIRLTMFCHLPPDATPAQARELEAFVASVREDVVTA